MHAIISHVKDKYGREGTSSSFNCTGFWFGSPSAIRSSHHLNQRDGGGQGCLPPCQPPPPPPPPSSARPVAADGISSCRSSSPFPHLNDLPCLIRIDIPSPSANLLFFFVLACCSLVSSLTIWHAYVEIHTSTRERRRGKEEEEDGVLLLSGGPAADGEKQQAGGRDLLALRWLRQRRRHGDPHAVLLRPRSS